MKSTVWLSRAAPAVLALLLWNPWTFEILIGTRSLYPAWARLAVFAPALGVAALCAASALLPRRRILAKLVLLAVSLALVAPLVGEGLIRLGIALDLSGLREPGLYADPHADDDYWKLAYAWNSEAQARVRTSAGRHPRIGLWNPGTRTNPRVVVRDEARDLPAGEDVVLFFGDSFVGGVRSVPPDLSLPAQIDDRLRGVAVINYGVGGYGVDQSYLRFEEAVRKLGGRRPVILFGVLTVDLDRTIVSVRDFFPKPRFALVDGELVLENVPLWESGAGDPARWFEEHPPAVRSYFAAYLARRMRWAAAGGRWWESGYRRDTKMQVNRRILEEVVSLARAQGLPLLFVLFANENELVTGWRGPFLARVFDELGVPWVDTRGAIRASPARAYGDDWHFNAIGNALAARAIAERLGQGLEGRVFEVVDREVGQLGRDADLYRMFVTPPDSVVCDPPPSPRQAYDLQVLLVGTPSEMSFSVGPGAWLVRGGFGILPRGYRQDGSDGVRFSVLARRPDGTERPLWNELLDPASRPEHRPPQALDVAFESQEPAEILLRTEAGPAGRPEGDLAYWTAVRIVPQGLESSARRDR